MKTYEHEKEGWRWLDVIAPTSDELVEIARRFEIPEAAVRDCLDPRHLPKLERFVDESKFMVVRGYDEKCGTAADEIRELTRKVALFIGKNLVVTVHRVDTPYMKDLRDRWPTISASAPSEMGSKFLSAVLLGATQSYEPALDEAFNRLERFEVSIFQRQTRARSLLREGYLLKRRAAVFRRMLRLLTDLLPEVETGKSYGPWQAPRDRLQRLLMAAEELQESVTSLVNLHLSLSSHRTNEIVRLLTVVSIFFLPLNFLAGVYGMNFEKMPGITAEYGFWVTLLAMSALSVGIFVWFRRKGWLK